MRKSLLLLLAWGMFTSAFSQPDILKKNIADSSEKWIITPVKGLKGTLGRLNPNSPPGPERSVLIYTQADKKFITSTPYNTKFYNLVPGNYRMTLNSVPVENVPIQKGHETRLKAGFLEVVNEGDWWLYDETKETLYTSGNKPGKIALPIGIYQLKQGEEYFRFEVNDEFLGHAAVSVFEDNRQYELIPTSENEEGSIVTRFPMANMGMTFNIFSTLYIMKQGESVPVFYCFNNPSPDHCPETYSLPEGIYDIHLGIKGESYATTNYSIIVQDVPVKKGNKTRLKVGYLAHKFKGIYKVFDESMQVNYLSYNFQLGPPPIPLPVGNYTIHMPNAGNFKVQINDGIKTEQTPIDSSQRPRWTITPISKIGASPLNSIKGGRIISQFPGSDTLKFILHIPQPDGTHKDVTLDRLEHYDTKPGIYTANLNNDLIEFPVEQGKQTKIRFGFMNLGAGTWTLYDLVSGKVFNYGIHSGTHKRALPIGFYVYKSSNTQIYLIKINEGKTTVPVITY